MDIPSLGTKFSLLYPQVAYNNFHIFSYIFTIHVGHILHFVSFCTDTSAGTYQKAKPGIMQLFSFECADWILKFRWGPSHSCGKHASSAGGNLGARQWVESGSPASQEILFFALGNRVSRQIRLVQLQEKYHFFMQAPLKSEMKWDEHFP